MADRQARPLRLIILTVLAVVLVGGGIALLPAPAPAPVTEVDAGVDSAITQPAAVADRRAALGAHQEELALRFEQAVVMLHAREYEHATTALQRVLALAPQMPEAHVNMGYARLGLQHYPEAVEAFAYATELRPGQANAYYGLALALAALERLPEARGAMRTYLHLASQEDPYRERAVALLSAWQGGHEGADAGQ